ncbi:hypothetical protein BH23BAC1_BH23BAC1_12780 [soil metagenome]
MKNLSLKVEDHIFKETETILNQLQKSRNRYINEALEFYNRIQKRKLLAGQLQKESKIVSSDSLDVLHEFEQLEDED